jgi:Ser/Thr protein kinase RdoA (MazF antagonist)
MMTLETMNRIVATVNEDWESELADQILLKWHAGGIKAKYWRASANFIFFFDMDDGEYVLRFRQDSSENSINIANELAFIKHLSERGIPVAQPVPSLSGLLVETVHTSHGVMQCNVFEKLSGEQKEYSDSLEAEDIRLWGQSMGSLHNASTTFVSPNTGSWRESLDFAISSLHGESKAVLKAIEWVQAKLDHLPISQKNFGVIHYDFELDNIIWVDGRPCPIDFDDCVSHWFVADIAFAVRDLFGDDANKFALGSDAFLQFIEGYRRERVVEQDDLELIPIFLHAHHIVALARLNQALTREVEGELDWMADLRSDLSSKMQHYRNILTIGLGV